MGFRTGAILVLTLTLSNAIGEAAAQPPRDLYTRALARERTVRDASRAPTLKQIRSAIAAYERIVRRYPRSGYSDNALWQAGNLALLAYERFGQASDRRTGERVLRLLTSEYPSSSLVGRVRSALAGFDEARARFAAPPPERRAVPVRAAPSKSAPAVTASEGESDVEPGVATIRGITRSALPDGVRVSIELDRELVYHQEQLENPRRLFFDLKGARPVQSLAARSLTYEEDLVREIRLGQHPDSTVRVVMDTEGVDSFSVFTLYNPYRLIVDFKRAAAAATPSTAADAVAAVSTTGPSQPDARPASLPSSDAVDKAPIPARRAVPPELSAPSVPSVNSNGQFSIARQLGLGISRIVLDPGHGGRDPGARGSGLNEATLVLDVAQRLKRLLEKQPGIEVVMTRDSDVYIPLEERTAIANRENADLFLSIHANASRNTKARGVETYFLNFASNPEAEAVAARENSASGRTMHSLPEIVRAIALNNKIDESRDFAEAVQKSMVQQLSARNKELRNLGVKQAPFVVLIGAGMPSVLAEISFITHKQEGQLLKTASYRQHIAQALHDAIVRYQRSLKTKSAIATR